VRRVILENVVLREVCKMKAIILLKTNPGFQKKAYTLLEGIRQKGVKIESQCHCFGRFDGAIVCTCDDLKALNQFAETLRREGVFYTETLIAVS
jgi:uncharacterized protein with GYD domain